MFDINRKTIRVWSMLGMRRVIGSVLEDLYQSKNNIIISVADVGKIIAYDSFYKYHPDNVFEMGIAEQNMVAACAGMVNEGFDVFAISYSTFITARALDQIRVNMGMMQLPLKLIGIGGGFAEGSLSATHLGIEDVSNMRCIPGLTVLVPADGLELVKMLFALLDYNKPTYVKITGGNNSPIINKDDYDFEIGKSVWLKDGKDIVIISNGVILKNVLDAAERLEKEGISAQVVNMHTVSPIDDRCLNALMEYKLVVTVEEHNVRGGLGGAVSEWFSDKYGSPCIYSIGFDSDSYPYENEYEILLEEYGLDSESIAKKIKDKYCNLLKNIDKHS